MKHLFSKVRSLVCHFRAETARVQFGCRLVPVRFFSTKNQSLFFVEKKIFFCGFATVLSFNKNWVFKPQIRKLPSLLKIRKLADFRFAELNCRPPTCGRQASVECTCCCVVQRFMPYLTQLLLRGNYQAETTCTKVKTFTVQQGSSLPTSYRRCCSIL
jgi:hypothetical protein